MERAEKQSPLNPNHSNDGDGSSRRTDGPFLPPWSWPKTRGATATEMRRWAFNRSSTKFAHAVFLNHDLDRDHDAHLSDLSDSDYMPVTNYLHLNGGLGQIASNGESPNFMALIRFPSHQLGSLSACAILAESVSCGHVLNIAKMTI
jgi:hypothetical protein